MFDARVLVVARHQVCTANQESVSVKIMTARAMQKSSRWRVFVTGRAREACTRLLRALFAFSFSRQSHVPLAWNSQGAFGTKLHSMTLRSASEFKLVQPAGTLWLGSSLMSNLVTHPAFRNRARALLLLDRASKSAPAGFSSAPSSPPTSGFTGCATAHASVTTNLTPGPSRAVGPELCPPSATPLEIGTPVSRTNSPSAAAT